MIPAKGVPAKDIPVRKREAVAPVVEAEEAKEPVEAVEVAAPKKATKKKLFSKE